MAKLRIGIIGCGDVAHRHYLPALTALADGIERPSQRRQPRGSRKSGMAPTHMLGYVPR